MTPDRWIVTITGLLLVAFIVWFFWMKRTKGVRAAATAGGKANPHFGPFHLLSFAFIGGGFILISNAWRVLYQAQRQGELAITGPYARVRHPQYLGFILVMFGFLLQWATLLTLAMFLVLVWMYVHLARQEEREARAQFSDAYASYAAATPAWFPALGKGASLSPPTGG
jgi:methanethiol S-methyltransferase